MSDESKFWLGIWAIAGIVLLNLFWAVAWGSTVNDNEAIRAGLVQKMEVGRQWPIWVKP